jgi:hypothetical protein
MRDDAPEPIPAPAIRTPRGSAKTRLAGIAVICAKCAKRQGLRPRDLRRLLKDAAGRAGEHLPRDARGRRRKLRLVASGCLGPCPKRAVAVATPASLAAGRVLLVDPAAGPDGMAAALLPEFGPNARLGPGAEPTPPA